MSIQGFIFLVKDAVLGYTIPTMQPELYPLKLYVTRFSVAVPLGASILLNLAMWGWLLWRVPYGESQIFLHYNVLFGVDFIGAWWKIFFIPLLGLVIALFNGAMGWVLFNRDKFIAQLFNGVGLVAQLLLFISSFLLSLLNA